MQRNEITKGTAMKGTGFSPYIPTLNEIRLQPLRGRLALDTAALRG